MQNLETILELVKELIQSQTVEQLQTAREKLRTAVGEESLALCYQLALNSEHSLESIAERTYLNQHCRNEYSDDELEKNDCLHFVFSISEGLNDFYIGELKRALPGISNYIFGELTDLNESPKAIVSLLRERNKL